MYRGSLNHGKLVFAECGILEEATAIANVARSAEGLEAALAAGRLLIFVPARPIGFRTTWDGWRSSHPNRVKRQARSYPRRPIGLRVVGPVRVMDDPCIGPPNPGHLRGLQASSL